jgi:hypothetical protein
LTTRARATSELLWARDGDQRLALDARLPRVDDVLDVVKALIGALGEILAKHLKEPVRERDERVVWHGGERVELGEVVSSLWHERSSFDVGRCGRTVGCAGEVTGPKVYLMAGTPRWRARTPTRNETGE